MRETQEKGITLIALVLTIILLMILAGVTIATLTGDNGILTKAQEAKEKIQIAEVIERAKTDILGIQSRNNGNITAEQIKQIVTKYFDNVPKTLPKDLETLTLTTKSEYGKHQIKISEIYQNSGKILLTASDIANNPNKAAYYGSIVEGYTCPNSAGVEKWKIFYADSSNIYLIASNNISSTFTPNEKNGSAIKVNGSDTTNLSFDNVKKDYLGSEDVTDSKIQDLNSNYFKYLSENSITDNSKSAKTIAYLMDTSIWNVYQGTKAEYAVGAPTLELLLKSYNQKYNSDYIARMVTIESYDISLDSGKTWRTSSD